MDVLLSSKWNHCCCNAFAYLVQFSAKLKLPTCVGHRWLHVEYNHSDIMCKTDFRWKLSFFVVKRDRKLHLLKNRWILNKPIASLSTCHLVFFGRPLCSVVFSFLFLRLPSTYITATPASEAVVWAVLATQYD